MREWGCEGGRGRGCRQGIDGRTAGEERRGEGGEVQRRREKCVVPPGGCAADRGRPGKDRDRPREKLAGEAVSGKRGVGSGAGAPAVLTRARLGVGRVLVLGAVGMPAVGMATAARLRTYDCRVVGRRSPPGAATAVIVGECGEQAGRQMHDEAQGHETATHCTSVEHNARPHEREKISPGGAEPRHANWLHFIYGRWPSQPRPTGPADDEIRSRPGFSPVG